MMVTVFEIIAACITGLFLVIMFFTHYILLSRKIKAADVAETIIPRRAELYREFLQNICGTGIQYDFETGPLTKQEKVVFLHDTCNRAMYELCPFAGINVINAIMKLSAVCAKHRPLVLEASGETIDRQWTAFKWAFQFDFLVMAPLLRSDCMGPALDRFITDANTRRFVASLSGWPWKIRGKARSGA
ncbi:MAG: hypothetical protein LBO80_12115 [Treponema sp.]|jgi:hypothetical protein|nr:hypothetical protein [Treponema sp.]